MAASVGGADAHFDTVGREVCGKSSVTAAHMAYVGDKAALCPTLRSGMARGWRSFIWTGQPLLLCSPPSVRKPAYIQLLQVFQSTHYVMLRRRKDTKPRIIGDDHGNGGEPPLPKSTRTHAPHHDKLEASSPPAEGVIACVPSRLPRRPRRLPSVPLPTPPAPAHVDMATATYQSIARAGWQRQHRSMHELAD